MMNPTLDKRYIRLFQRAGEHARSVATSPEAFAKLYLSRHMAKPPSQMHRELNDLLIDVADRPGAQLAIAAPRGSAKSTFITLAFVLWVLCHRKFRFIVLISDTAEKACEFLDHLKEELVNNERLGQTYPEFCEPNGQRPKWPRWRANEIITCNRVKICAMGYGQNIRGKRNAESRPDLIILDDAECRENTHSTEAREKLFEWFNKAVLKAGTRDTRVIVAGTIQHYGSLLATLTNRQKSPNWRSKIYRSVISNAKRMDLWESWTGIYRSRLSFEEETGVEAARRYFEAYRDIMLEGTEVLWPEVRDYYALMEMRETEGPASFDSEMQNEPVSAETCFFVEDEFQYWEDRYPNEKILLDTLLPRGVIVGACDPSLGKEGKHGDDSAIITLLKDKDGVFYVLDADINYRKPDRLIADLIQYQRLRKYRIFGFETNQFQEFVADVLTRQSRAAGVQLPLEKVNHTTDKMGRIQMLQPLVRSGGILFSRRHVRLLEQLRYFPKASHDDGPDALEMAVQMAGRVSNSASLALLARYAREAMEERKARYRW